MSLSDRVVEGDPRAVARAISIVEDDGPDAPALLARLHARTGRAFLVGITGPAGTGKSTLVDQLVREYRKTCPKVAVLAIDPSSAYTGGALLGDRVRMQAHASDPGVFIRSMATRGQLGGLARAAAEAASVLDAAGFDPILIETVGVGQDEVDVARLADATVVLAVPGAGDDVQALKAGLMEVADVFVVNKADRDGADRVAAEIESALSLAEQPPEGWRPPVILTVATSGAGVAELVEALTRFRHEVRVRRDGRRLARDEWHLRQRIAQRAVATIEHDVLEPAEWASIVDAVSRRDADPYAVADVLIARLRSGGLPVQDIDHIGIATRSLEDGRAAWAPYLGAAVDAVEEIPSQQVRVQFLGAGPARVELIEPTTDDSPMAKSLRARGPGLHHVAIRVDDLDARLTELEARGVRLIDRVPRPGAHGTRVAFVHPSASGGVLLELVERPKAAHAPR